jgi:Protein of unknown function (DUF1403)
VSFFGFRALESAISYIESNMSDKASLSDIYRRRQPVRKPAKNLAKTAQARHASPKMIRAEEAVTSADAPPIAPRLAPPARRVSSNGEAAFLAGIALNRLDQIVRADPPWLGAWRQRLALKNAAAAVRRMGLKEDEAQLRDAWNLRSAGGDPGPAGRVYGAWRSLASRPPTIREKDLKTIAAWLGAAWSDALADIPSRLERSDRAAPFAAASIIAATVAARPDAELFAWRLGDLALARQMRWPVAVPLLMGEFHSEIFRTGRGRIQPGGEDFERAICLALVNAATEACRLAEAIARRAARLQAVAPKLRAKGAGEALKLLLDDDAVAGSLTTPNLSRFASRRLFERLSTLDAVRELTGRATFRLYGL